MAKGRNTSVLSVRVTDELAKRLKAEARRRKLVLNDYLKSVLATYWRLPSTVYLNEQEHEYVSRNRDSEMETDLLEKSPDYRKSPEPKREIKFPGTPRNAPCPCGALRPDGRPKKYKYCCGR